MAFSSITDKLIDKKSKKQKHKHPNDQTTKPSHSGKTSTAEKTSAASTSGNDTNSTLSFKPSSEVKGLKFGGQFIVKSFTIRRARPLELLKLLSLPPQSPPPLQTLQTPQNNPNPSPYSTTTTRTSKSTTAGTKDKLPFSSTIAFIPTNFTILAHQAWHTLTLGLGTKKSKVLIVVFESESMKCFMDKVWPTEIPLGEVNKKLLRGLSGCELARFKFRKGCITFYVYAVRSEGTGVYNCFGCIDDLKEILSSVVALNDFVDHTAVLAMPNQRSITSSGSHHGGGRGNSSDHHEHRQLQQQQQHLQRQYSVAAMAH